MIEQTPGDTRQQRVPTAERSLYNLCICLCGLNGNCLGFGADCKHENYVQELIYTVERGRDDVAQLSVAGYTHTGWLHLCVSTASLFSIYYWNTSCVVCPPPHIQSMIQSDWKDSIMWEADTHQFNRQWDLSQEFIVYWLRDVVETCAGFPLAVAPLSSICHDMTALSVRDTYSWTWQLAGERADGFDFLMVHDGHGWWRYSSWQATPHLKPIACSF